MRQFYLTTFAALAALAIGTPITTGAQAPEDQDSTLRLSVGDARVSGSHIRPFEVTWLATPYTSDGVAGRSNRVREKVELVEQDAGSLLRFTQVWYDTVDAVVFTTVRVADRATMAYRAFHTGGAPGGFGHLDFDGAQVSGVYVSTPEGPSQYFSLVFDDPVFASLSGLLFSAFPLEPGFEATFPGFGWGGTTNPAQVSQTIKVVGREGVSIPGAPEFDAYRTVTSRGPGSELIFWISREAPYFVRAEARSSSGSYRVFEVEEWKPLE
ncbi:MAG: hypothetical protein ABFS34_08625 [Gemmatimonadota bacterium]